MRIFSRRPNEALVTHDEIKITVIKIRDDTVSIGVRAPKQLPVFRSERHLQAGDTSHEPPRSVFDSDTE
ncbi:carbon storage regulator [Pseudomonas canadensis]|uniref:carbon storage regulator n=1 Tax=Pseudomonas canadensis TaxID=915099 RepID=UPI003B9DCF7D